ncbi:alpha/beta hydrolase [Gilvimarinus xylanilyticus]|uniref:Dienelactone hydrolase family protein n=1 Tax=Gilvimarinus xylanilyticus TaxID=2944139 RepID=A0A9X2HZV6_9GAMM|nr:alpha/beta family hydrolase [Gilvimarinus xylanilyticus]MCP8897725.1 dienelactone hydrolase family protein [Gilvimarinus xylanilyticus]
MTDVFAQKGKFTLDGPAGRLEVAASAGDANGPYRGRNLCAVVAHPHPLHGGTMDNKVVTTLQRCYRDLGVDSLRFNFRGVGASEGEHDHAVGEVDDMLAVLRAAEAARPGAEFLVAGFSFGSSVAARASYHVNAAHLCLVAPPIPRYDFDREGQFNAPLTVLQGERDERVEAQAVKTWSESLRGVVRYHAFADTGHFFHGQLVALKETLSADLQRLLPPEGGA